jgi:hypothetical protein
MSSAKEIEVAIQALSPTEREKLVADLPSILPELRGEPAWPRIMDDSRPRPALTALGDKIATERNPKPATSRRAGTPEAILDAVSESPHLSEADVVALETALQSAKLPVHEGLVLNDKR